MKGRLFDPSEGEFLFGQIIFFFCIAWEENLFQIIPNPKYLYTINSKFDKPE